MNKYVLLSLLVLTLLIGVTSVLADELELPSGLVQIENEAFMGDTSLDTIILPKGVNSIGDRAFANSSIKRIYLPESITYIGNNAFYGCNSIIGYGPEGTYASEYFKMHSIPFEAEWNASPLGDFSFKSLSSTTCEIEKYIGSQTSIIIPKVDGTGRKVVSIGESAFYNNKKISNVAIPDTVLVIKAKAFMGCESIFEFSFPDSIVSFEDYAFYGCSSLRNVNIPESLTEIGWAAFFNCNFVFSFTVPENNPHFSALDGVLFNKDKTELIRYPAGHNRHTYTIPDSVIIIGDDAFRASSALKDIIIPEGVKTIGWCSFYDCSGLSTVTLPNGIESIGDCAFAYCYLSEINLPNSITKIGNTPFESNPDINIVVTRNSYAYRWAIEQNYFSDNRTVIGQFDISSMYVEQYDPVSTTYTVSVSDGWIRQITIYCISAGYSEIISVPFKNEHIAEYHGEWTVPAKIRNTPGSYIVAIDVIDNNGLGYFTGSMPVGVVEYNPADIVILQQPQTQYIYQNIFGEREPSKAELKVVAENVSSYQWYGLTNEGWTEMAGMTSDTYTCGKVTASLRIGLYGEATFCCRLIGNNGTTQFTDAASVRLFVDDISLDLNSIELNIGETKKLNATLQTDRAYNKTVLWESSDPNIVGVDTNGTITAKASGTATITAYAADNGGSSDTCIVVIKKDLTPSPLSDFVFTELDNSSCRIEKYIGNAKEVVIPKEDAYGNVIVSIGEDSFADCDSIISMYIPDNIEIINDYAFAGCINLNSVYISNNVRRIGMGAFEECYSLETVNLPDKLRRIPDSLFYNCKKLQSVEIPDSITWIGLSSFTGSGIHRIIIPNNNVVISAGAFSYCDKLYYVFIPQSVIRIDEDAFEGSENITIYGKPMSYAEQYANDNSIPFIQADTHIYNPEIFVTYSGPTTTNGYSYSLPITIKIEKGMNLVGETEFDVYPTVTNPRLIITLPECCECNNVFNISADDPEHTIAILDEQVFPEYSQGVYLNNLSNSFGNIDKVVAHIHCSKAFDLEHSRDHDILISVISDNGYSFGPIHIPIRIQDITDINQEPEFRALCIGENYKSIYTQLIPGFYGDQLIDCIDAARDLSDLLVTYGYTSSFYPDASSSRILQSIYYLSTIAKEDDVTLFAFAGHGEEGTGALCTYQNGSDWGRITVNELMNAFSAVKGKKILIFGSCYSGNFITNNSMLTDDYVILCACYADQSAMEAILDDGTGFDLFIRGLIDGITGFSADNNDDNMITANELADFVNNLIDESKKQNPEKWLVVDQTAFTNNSGDDIPIVFR